MRSILILLVFIAFCSTSVLAQSDDAVAPRSKVVLLGTGNPNPDPEHAGPAVAVVVDDQAYLVDAGAGIVRRAAKLSPRYGGAVTALAASKLNILFLTHLHSDHTVGLPDLMLTPWVMGRDRPLQIYGPEGTSDMMSHLQKAYSADIQYRLFGEEPANNQGWRTAVTEVDTGLVYADSLVRVEAFAVPHGSWPVSLAYRFTTPDRVIVISGDSRPSETIARIARGADVLVHEVYYARGLEEGRRHAWQSYHHAHHTSTIELGRIAAQARPKLLLLYHILFWGASEQDLLDEVHSTYDGEVRVGRDLGIY